MTGSPLSLRLRGGKGPGVRGATVNNRRSLLIILLILLLAFALRGYALGDKTVWWDEAWSVVTAQQPFAQTTEITADDVHPPLYQWLLHVWVRIAGISEFAVRYVSVLWGLLTVAAVYPLTLRLGGKRAALLATFFIALSAFHAHWSQETRMYSMAACAAALACYAYLRIDQRWSGWWILLIAAGAGAALTHYLGILALAILNLHWLLTIRSRPRSFNFRWIGAMVIAGAIILAWMLYAITRIRGGGTDSSAPPVFIFQLAATLLAVGTSVNVDQFVWPALIVVIGLLIGLLIYTRRQPRNGLLILLLTFVPPVAIFILTFPNRFYHPAPEERYLLILIPPVYAGVGLALNALFKVRRTVGVIATLGLFGLYSFAYLSYADTRYFRDDYAMMIRTVNTLAASNEPVFFISGDRYPLVDYHLHRVDSTINAVGIDLVDKNDVDSIMKQTIGSSSRFWVIEIERNLGDPDNVAIPWLDSHYQRVLHIPIDYNGITLYTSADKTTPDSSAIVPPVIHEARPGDVVRIGVPSNTRVQLLYQGQPIALQSASNTWQLAQFPIYPAFPNGDYSVQAGENRYAFRVTHSQPPLSGEASNATQIGSFHLLGYDVSTRQLHPGDSLALTLNWRVDQTPTANYTVFAHLIGSAFNPATNGPVWAGKDSYPADTPTTAMWSGLAFTDQRTLTLPPDTPPGDYQLEFGLYQLDTGKRLTFPDGSDRILVSGFKVVR